MPGRAMQLPDGALGFDCNAPVGLEDARAFYERGRRFAVRYIRREPIHDFDLSRDEVERLHDAGLAVSLVQHVESEDAWQPNAVKGSRTGNIAVEECLKLGVPQGVTVWLDLEGVAAGVAVADIIAHCQAWYEAVRLAHFSPGLYVGYRCGLTADELYHSLSFPRYWAAYNAPVMPSVRGFSMRQHVARPDDTPHGLRYPIDTDTVQRDKLGGLPTAWVPDGWTP